MKTYIKLYDEISHKESSKKNETVGSLARTKFICGLISLERFLDNNCFTDNYFVKYLDLDIKVVQRCKRYFEGLGLIKVEGSKRGSKYSLFKSKIDRYYSVPGDNDSFFTVPSKETNSNLANQQQDNPPSKQVGSSSKTTIKKEVFPKTSKITKGAQADGDMASHYRHLGERRMAQNGKDVQSTVPETDALVGPENGLIPDLRFEPDSIFGILMPGGPR